MVDYLSWVFWLVNSTLQQMMLNQFFQFILAAFAMLMAAVLLLRLFKVAKK